MTVRRRPGLPFSASIYVQRRAACVDGEHDMKCTDHLADPKYYRCTDCQVYGFIRRKGGALRNGRMVLYTCSTKGCTKTARIRSKYRGTGGAFDWACCPAHARGDKFAGRVTEQELADAPTLEAAE